MNLNKKEVANNLRIFGYKKFGTMKKFAEALDMNPSTLYSGYLNGRSLPGPVLLVKLIDMECNINWLLTSRGKPFQEISEKDYINKLEEEINILRTTNSRLMLNNTTTEKRFETIRVAQEIL